MYSKLYYMGTTYTKVVPVVSRTSSETQTHEFVLTKRSSSGNLLYNSKKWAESISDEVTPEKCGFYLLHSTKVPIDILEGWCNNDMYRCDDNSMLAVSNSLHKIYKSYTFIGENEKAEPFFELYLKIENISRKIQRERDSLNFIKKTVKNYLSSIKNDITTRTSLELQRSEKSDTEDEL